MKIQNGQLPFIEKEKEKNHRKLSVLKENRRKVPLASADELAAQLLVGCIGSCAHQPKECHGSKGPSPSVFGFWKKKSEFVSSLKDQPSLEIEEGSRN